MSDDQDRIQMSRTTYNAALLTAVEFGFRYGENGKQNLQGTLQLARQLILEARETHGSISRAVIPK